MAPKDQGQAICQVVRFDVKDDEQLTTALTVRVRRRWFHITTDVDSLCSKSPETKSKTPSLKDTYIRLRNAVIDQQTRDDPEEQSHENTDSGYASDQASSGTPSDPSANHDAETDMQNWLLAPFGKVFDDLAPRIKEDRQQRTIHDWYSDGVYSFELQADEEEELKPIEVQDEDRLKNVRQSFCPSMTLPKYLRNLPGVPWYSPKDLEVLVESEDPAPVHPTIVRRTSQENTGKEDAETDHPDTFFFKVHAPNQDPSTKREIRCLQDIKKKALHDKGVRTPQLLGLVASIDSPSSKAQVLGFLLTSISNPTPLNVKLDSSVAQSKREKWAKESEHMVDTLHEAGLVWGDAKADNFVLDENEKLWMIDFGGGYTEGWVDSELLETRQGDNQGTDKVVDALKDPDNNTCDDLQEQSEHDSRTPLKKRKRQGESNDEKDSEIPQERRKNVKR